MNLANQIHTARVDSTDPEAQFRKELALSEDKHHIVSSSNVFRFETE